MMRVVLLLLRRLWLPLVFFLGFSLMCVLVYQHRKRALAGCAFLDHQSSRDRIPQSPATPRNSFPSSSTLTFSPSKSGWPNGCSPFSTVRAWRPGGLWSTTSAFTDRQDELSRISSPAWTFLSCSLKP